jgi:large subunit ribosomal protein L6
VLDPTLKAQRAVWGLSRTLINNAIKGLTIGLSLPIRIVGVGYKGELQDNPSPPPGFTAKRIFLKVNRAHSVWVNIPEGIEATVPYPTKIVLWGTDKQKLGQLAAEIRRWRRPEPYKGKVGHASTLCLASTEHNFYLVFQNNRAYSWVMKQSN